MAGVGEASAIIGITMTVLAVSKSLKKTAKTIVHAQKELEAVSKEINMFSTLLLLFKETVIDKVEAAQSRVLDSTKAKRFQDTLHNEAQGLVKNFKILVKDLQPLRRKKGQKAGLLLQGKARLYWWFSVKDEVKLLQGLLEKTKTSLNIWVTIVQLGLHLDERSKVTRGLESEALLVTM
jgi:hypothetical protein